MVNLLTGEAAAAALLTSTAETSLTGPVGEPATAVPVVNTAPAPENNVLNNVAAVVTSENVQGPLVLGGIALLAYLLLKK